MTPAGILAQAMSVSGTIEAAAAPRLGRAQAGERRANNHNPTQHDRELTRRE
jgi:hypothetical protein